MSAALDKSLDEIIGSKPAVKQANSKKSRGKASKNTRARPGKKAAPKKAVAPVKKAAPVAPTTVGATKAIIHGLVCVK